MSTSDQLLKENVERVMKDDTLGKVSSDKFSIVESMVAATAKNLLKEDATTNQTSGIGQWSSVLINMVRRAAPQLMAHDIMGVQPLQTSTAQIFAMRARYNDQRGAEALFNEPDSAHSGTGSAVGDSSGFPAAFGGVDVGTEAGHGMHTVAGEGLGGAGKEGWAEMGLTVEGISVTAKTRKLKAQLTREMEQDLQTNHNLSATEELTKMLAAEIRGEIDRECVRVQNISAKVGLQSGTTDKGIFNLAKDAIGPGKVDQLRELVYRIELESNAVARATRRGNPNRIIASPNIVSALNMFNLLDYNERDAAVLNTDTAVSCFAGILNGKFRVYVDPYATRDYVSVAYKGDNAWDAGMYFCPYLPLEMYTATDPDTMNPVLGFASRYGIVSNPFNYRDAEGNVAAGKGMGQGENSYARKFLVTGL